MFRSASRHGRTHVLEYMVNNGFNLDNVGARYLLHELMLECAHGKCKEVELTRSVVLLVSRSLSDINKFLAHLFYLYAKGSYGYNVNSMHGDNSMTPLHLACMYRLKTLFKVLVYHNADVHAIDDNDMTPLDYASDPAMREALLRLSQEGNGPSASLRSRKGLCTYSA